MNATITIRAVAAFALAVALTACGDASVTPPTTPEPDPLLEGLALMGLSAAHVVDGGTFFLVEGDIRVEKADLEQLLSTPVIAPPQFQWRQGLVGYAHQNVRVNLSHIAGYPDWAKAAREAMTHWNGVPGTTLRFVEDSYTPHTNVYTYNSQTGTDRCGGGSTTVACAKLPTSGGYPGSFVYINLGASPITYSGKVFNMVHEFGHTIAYRHTNTSGCGASSGATHIPGTPTSSDPGSVMTGCTGGSTWYGFSFYDQVAQRKLYGAVGPAPTGSVENGHPKVTWTAVPGATEYKVMMEFDTGMGYAVYSLEATTTTNSAVLTTWNASAAAPCSWVPGESRFKVTANFPGGPESAMSWDAACFVLE